MSKRIRSKVAVSEAGVSVRAWAVGPKSLGLDPELLLSSPVTSGKWPLFSASVLPSVKWEYPSAPSWRCCEHDMICPELLEQLLTVSAP